MDVITTTSSKKRTRAKAPAPTQPKPVRATLTARPKKPRTPPLTAAMPEPIADLRAAIEREAFYLAAARGFTAGGELDDWLEAERRIKGR